MKKIFYILIFCFMFSLSTLVAKADNVYINATWVNYFCADNTLCDGEAPSFNNSTSMPYYYFQFVGAYNNSITRAQINVSRPTGWEKSKPYDVSFIFALNSMVTDDPVLPVVTLANNVCDVTPQYSTESYKFYGVYCTNVNVNEEFLVNIWVKGYVAGVNNYNHYLYFYLINTWSIMPHFADSGASGVVGAIEGVQQYQKETIDKIKEANDLISSDSDDTESKSCGIICKLKGIFTGIIELPKKLVELLIDALKSLFVPSDEQLLEIIDDSKELSENFGFVGEAINFFITLFTSLLGMVNANGCVEFPAFSIGSTSLFDGMTFWDSQQVCLADNAILSNNITTIRTITSIVLVCLFINFASSKFFSILSKSDNGKSDG